VFVRFYYLQKSQKNFAIHEVNLLLASNSYQHVDSEHEPYHPTDLNFY